MASTASVNLGVGMTERSGPFHVDPFDDERRVQPAAASRVAERTTLVVGEYKGFRIVLAQASLLEVSPRTVFGGTQNPSGTYGRVPVPSSLTPTVTSRSGKEGSSAWVYIFKLAEGKVHSYDQFNDTGLAKAFR